MRKVPYVVLIVGIPKAVAATAQEALLVEEGLPPFVRQAMAAQSISAVPPNSAHNKKGKKQRSALCARGFHAHKRRQVSPNKEKNRRRLMRQFGHL